MRFLARGGHAAICRDYSSRFSELFAAASVLFVPDEYTNLHEDLISELQTGRNGFLVLANFSERVSLFVLMVQGTGEMKVGAALLEDCMAILSKVKMTLDRQN